jgi:hypothetical protein
MRRPALLATTLSAFASGAIAAGEAPVAPNFADAMRAYYASDYPTCASILVELAKLPDPRLARIAYNAARCLALSGRIDAAFRSLEQAIAVDLVSVKDLEADADLSALRSDAAWLAFRDRAAQRERTQLAAINRALRDELLARMERHQSAFGKLGGPEASEQALVAEVARIDADNTAWMKQVIATHGWPGRSMVSKDGAKAAALLAQNADQDRDFQKQALLLLETAVASGEAEAADLAHLIDRVLVAQGKPQRYGTQFHVVDGKLLPHPIEDEASVDLLRALAGLPSLAEYKKAMLPKE